MARLNELSAEYLSEIPSETLPETLFDYAINEVNDLLDQEYEIIQGLPKKIRLNYALWKFQSEIQNGGLNQFFLSTSGIFAQDLVGYLEEIQASDSSIYLARAIELINEELDSEEEFRDKIFNGELPALDNSETVLELDELSLALQEENLAIYPLLLRHLSIDINDLLND